MILGSQLSYIKTLMNIKFVETTLRKQMLLYYAEQRYESVMRLVA